MRGDLSLYLIAGQALTGGRPLAQVVAAAGRGGATAVQLREKDVTDRELYQRGQAVQAVCREAGMLFLVNDRVDLALALDADGVHLGQDDLPAAVARRLLGPDKVLGITVETPEEAHRAWQDGADYLGTGPIFATQTKPDAGAPYGPAVVGRVRAATPLPVVAVGGITVENAGPVVKAGAAGLALASALMTAPDPEAVARTFRRAIEAARSQ